MKMSIAKLIPVAAKLDNFKYLFAIFGILLLFHSDNLLMNNLFNLASELYSNRHNTGYFNNDRIDLVKKKGKHRKSPNHII